MRKILPHIVWLSGLLLFVFGLRYVPDIMPYEVSPEMRADYRRQHILSDIGCLVYVSGVIWAVVRWINRRLSDDK
jgi:hypothetical protein